MKIMNKKKWLSVVSISAVLALSACSQDNPLTSQPQTDTVKFLIAASTAAEKELHFQALHYGSAYGSCVMGKFRHQADCPLLYQTMVEYAQESNGPFKGITVEDLQNQKAFAPLQESYAATNFNSVD